MTWEHFLSAVTVVAIAVAAWDATLPWSLK